ncbi:LamG domain-containing protein [Saccharobesus litoralis]|uniref:LamG domain-containing protein n=1 Tax=Saccharobesus litoralis TaxID=2172099 RepID=UPI001E5E5E49|nr:LamG domain-containing protein [Saccharobesus litoralis]
MKHYFNRHCIFAFILITLCACGGGEVESIPPEQIEEKSNVYKGPAAQTEDIRKFQQSVWQNITPNKCGDCHNEEEGQAPYFADFANVNLAYSAAFSLVDLTDADNSRLVTKVANGHNCWLASDQACADTMTQWIRLWAGDRESKVNEIDFTAPEEKDPGESKSFPDSSSVFNTQVHPILTQYCGHCHQESAQFAQSPFFASNDAALSYEAAKRVINLDQPEMSRLVVRLTNEFHNCWSNCQLNGQEMLTAVKALSDSITPNKVDSNFIISKALRMTDGVVAATGGRYESDVIALYQFKTGSGAIAYDTSPVSPAANLRLSGNIEWLGSWGVKINSGKAQASTADSKKIHDLIVSTGEFAIETWVTPGNVFQEGPARIISYSSGDTERNFTLGQTLYNYDFMLRTSANSPNGEPALSTPDADEVLQATLQHVVITYKPNEGRKLYVNGELIDVSDEEMSPIANWNDSFALMIGNEASNNYQWQGSMRYLAIFNRALTPEQIKQNFDVGVGQKFFLLFSISDIINLPNTYVLFEVSQFDNYSYLFSTPKLVNLDGNSLPEDLPIKGMRLGINGKESEVGQSFASMNRVVSKNINISTAEPYPISRLGTIIPIENGSEQDEFFLTFEQLADKTYVRSEPAVSTPVETPDDTAQPSIGMRNFAEINASMSQLTGIPASNAKVRSTYQLVQRQLPSGENIETFVSAQQMAITQLAIAYCDQAIEDTSIRTSWLPTIDFTQASNVALLSIAQRQELVNGILNKMLPSNLQSQPLKSELLPTLEEQLVRPLSTICPGGCDAERTKTVAKSTCAAVMASATLLIQ